MTPKHTIEPPLPRLLAIHRACTLLLHLSGAGAYTDKILRDLEELAVRSDGKTDLGTLVDLAFHRLVVYSATFVLWMLRNVVSASKTEPSKSIT